MNAEEIRLRAGALVKKIYETSRSEPLPEVLVLLGDDGVLDSVSMLELIVGIEREFGISVRSEDICPENFKDVESLAQFILRNLP